MKLRAVALVVALAALFAPAATADAGLPPIKHVFIIVLENKGFDKTFGYRSPAPYLSLTLPGEGALLPNYHGVTHESLGNYIALISGQGSNPVTQADCPVYADVLPGTLGANGQALGVGCVYPKTAQTIAGQLTSAGLSWKGYMEDMGTPCRHPAIGTADNTQTARKNDQYAARHNPFVYFHSIIDTPACAQDDVPLDRLGPDLASAATTPSLAFITPNLCDDGHDAKCASGDTGGLPRVDRFLQTWVPRITASPAYADGGLLAIIFDESDGTDATACCGEIGFPDTINNGGPFPGSGGGRTGAVLLSPLIDPGTVDNTPYNHFTLLRSIEDMFGLGHLGFAALPGGQSLGADAFTCYASDPVAAAGRLPPGSLVKWAVIGQGSAPRPMVELKLWHAGRVMVTVRGVKRFVGHRRASPCALTKIQLPRAHGIAVVVAQAFGGSERRTLRF